MKAQSNDALREALSLLQEMALSPFTAEPPQGDRTEMAELDQLFLLNIQMRRANLDRWIRLLNQEVERRTEAVRERKLRRTRTAETESRRLPASA